MDSKRATDTKPAGLLPAVGVVQVGEEKDPAAEEGEQHDAAVDFVQQQLLLVVLKNNREAGRRRPPGVRGMSTKRQKMSQHQVELRRARQPPAVQTGEP